MITYKTLVKMFNAWFAQELLLSSEYKVSKKLALNMSIIFHTNTCHLGAAQVLSPIKIYTKISFSILL